VKWSKNIKLCLSSSLVIASLSGQASFLIDISTNYTSDSDDVDNLAFNKMDNRIFLGASLDKKNKFYFGQNAMLLSREFQTAAGTTDTVSVTEIGPRFQYFFNEGKNVFIAAAWNPYAKGERTRSNTTEEISGSSYFVSLGYGIKISRKLNLGASLNYHVLSIAKVTDTSNVESEVTQAYTSIYPMIEFSFRFK
jgi:hypothetical protein